jgi:hypothetical protein
MTGDGLEIPHRVEVYFSDDRPMTTYHQIKILDSGWMVGINETAYKADYIPPGKIKKISTHTTDEQEANFQTKEVADD